MACNNDCKNCGSDCGDRKEQSLKFKANPNSNIKHIIGIVSGKGGVGKSLVTSMLAATLNQKGYKVGILDADITGPSIPTAFGITEKITGDSNTMYPQESAEGVKVMSINLLLEDVTAPVVWRGPVISGALKQFYTDTAWEEIDYLFVDMPPGTGEVPLTIFQSLDVNGIVIVSTPQDLVSMIVNKAVNMANMMKVNIIGLVENMAYVTCPSCDEVIYPFGPSRLEEVANTYGIKPLASLGIDPAISYIVDNGLVGKTTFNDLDLIIEEILKL